MSETDRLQQQKTTLGSTCANQEQDSKITDCSHENWIGENWENICSNNQLLQSYSFGEHMLTVISDSCSWLFYIVYI